MMTIDYDKLPYYEKKDIGESVVRNAFYLRDNDEVDFSDVYNGYHTHDYFGFNMADAFEESAFIINNKD